MLVVTLQKADINPPSFQMFSYNVLVPLGCKCTPLTFVSICHPIVIHLLRYLAEIYNIIRKLYYALQNDVILSLLEHDVMT